MDHPTGALLLKSFYLSPRNSSSAKVRYVQPLIGCETNQIEATKYVVEKQQRNAIQYSLPRVVVLVRSEAHRNLIQKVTPAPGDACLQRFWERLCEPLTISKLAGNFGPHRNARLKWAKAHERPGNQAAGYLSAFLELSFVQRLNTGVNNRRTRKCLLKYYLYSYDRLILL